MKDAFNFSKVRLHNLTHFTLNFKLMNKMPPWWSFFFKILDNFHNSRQIWYIIYDVHDVAKLGLAILWWKETRAKNPPKPKIFPYTYHLAACCCLCSESRPAHFLSDWLPACQIKRPRKLVSWASGHGEYRTDRGERGGGATWRRETRISVARRILWLVVGCRESPKFHWLL